MTLAILLFLEVCHVATNGSDWVCVSKPTKNIVCFRNAQRFECLMVPYQPRRMV